jgi:translation initiation factor IF-3
MFRGREQAHPERGRALLQRLVEDLGELAIVESQPLQEGRNMSMLVGPGKEAAKEQPVAAEAEPKASESAPGKNTSSEDAPLGDEPGEDAPAAAAG